MTSLERLTTLAAIGAIVLSALDAGATGTVPFEPITFEFGTPSIRLGGLSL
jgi:hypothetical protein